MNRRFSKFNNEKVFVVSRHEFSTRKAAEYWCRSRGIDPTEVTEFDSRKEHKRWQQLLLLERAGRITQLRRQVSFELIPKMEETVQTGTKQVTRYIVRGEEFTSKRAALAWRDEHSPNEFIVKVIREEPIFRKRVIEREAVYTADFTYVLPDGSLVVEDVKSEYTRKEKDYVLRRKLMLYRHGIKIKET